MHREAILARLGTLRNLVAEYTRELTCMRPVLPKEFKDQLDAANQAESKQLGVTFAEDQFPEGNMVRVEEFWILGPRVKIISRAPPGSRKGPALDFYANQRAATYSWDENVQQQLIENWDTQVPPHGNIRKGSNYGMYNVLDLGLGIRAYGAIQWLGKSDIEKAQFTTDSAGGLVTMTLRGEALDVWTYDPSRAYAMIKYERSLLSGELGTQVVCSEFTQVGSLYLPLLINMKEYMNGILPPTAPPLRVTVIRVARMTLDDPRNTPEAYTIAWPKEAVVRDTIRNVRYRGDGSPMGVVDLRGPRLAKEGLGGRGWLFLSGAAAMVTAYALYRLSRGKPAVR